MNIDVLKWDEYRSDISFKSEYSSEYRSDISYESEYSSEYRSDILYKAGLISGRFNQASDGKNVD